ncbi:hypothetical protein CYLTODRAFT_425490 [Cylindrobasidium torrendii FP15055 ss-10]|uniref:RING-type domain-containing protein n=1 Tax=Cylindrobasidium torrendii FP15055 ss-10 TaxID=1314674 RepID=A0A0D7B1Q5_9AGAR|nr:hypothetical protein CYLTODRAFT_425490 [Cylindrobasidium torrendii FP15055 ss-10]
MGNSSSSSGRHNGDESVDCGQLVPQGVYTGPRDWNQAIVAQLICARKLAPFYRPLEDYEEDWDDERILAARKELPEPEPGTEPTTSSRLDPTPSTKSGSSSKRPATQKDPVRSEAAIYRGAVECPICFLYYPQNINHSRCCDHPICTECFVQIKRSEPTATHLVSEPAACPYCVQEHFGVVYKPPPWRTGIGGDGISSPWSDSPKEHAEPPTHKRRQKSFGADSPEVVTTDQIRPDWEAKLGAVRAAVARRANRRIIMRQVGDRLIPVGVTSGRVQALSPEDVEQESGGSGSRRSRRRQQQPVVPGFEQYVGMPGQDLEELMVMEAMRLSLIEHEEQQKKEAEEKKKKDAEAATAGARTPTVGSSAPVLPEIDTSNPRSSSSSSKRRSFLAGSRSPSPSSIAAGSDKSTWRKRLSNSSPMQTLNTALGGTATTATTFLNTSGPPTPTPEVAGPSTISTTESSPPLEQTVSRPVPTHADSMVSFDSAVSHSEAYDNLPSSPESSLAHEPLLDDDRSVNGDDGTATAKFPAREPFSDEATGTV